MNDYSIQSPEVKRVYFYVDGFNLYHRRLKGNPSLKWLCLRSLAQRQFKDCVISKVKFFTAKIDPRSNQSPKQARQQCYWRALQTTNVEIIEGIMELRERRCRAFHVCDKGATFAQYTEKMSDVNLALHIYRDFLNERPDVICVLSADLDVVPALRMIRDTRIRVKIVSLLPSDDEGLLVTRRPEFTQIAITKQLSSSHLRDSRLPEEVVLSSGEVLHCPFEWRINPARKSTL